MLWCDGAALFIAGVQWVFSSQAEEPTLLVGAVVENAVKDDWVFDAGTSISVFTTYIYVIDTLSDRTFLF